MNRLLKTALAAAALTLGATLATSSHAAAYKCMDDKGKAVYSDIPCAKKEPPPKVEAVKIVKPDPSVLTKLTEPEVVRLVGLTDDYTRSYNHVDLCGLYATDMKYQLDNQVVKPPRTMTAGREEACQVARDNADQSRKAGLVVISDRSQTKVSIQPGDLRANVTYESTMKLTRYDRVISTYHCSSKAEVVLLNGKALFSALADSCKP